MRFKTSYSKEKLIHGTLFRKNLTRFWPLWAVYAAVWLFVGPMNEFMILFGADNRNESIEYIRSEAVETLLETASRAGLFLAVVFGALFAMALFSYLYSARSIGMMHSFPISRKSLFVTNYVTGLVVLVTTLLVNAGLLAIILGTGGALGWKHLASWLGCTLGEMVFFYSFAVFCGMFTGQILAVPVFYGLLNGAAYALSATIQLLAYEFLYGYNSAYVAPWASWLTPILKLRLVRYAGDWDNHLNYRTNQTLLGLDVVAIYFMAGLVLAALAYVVYQRRRSESAGDIVSVQWAKQLFRFGAGLYAALTLGQLLYHFIKDGFLSDTARDNLPLTLFCMVLLALIGFYAAEMLLEKSFRVFRKAWKGAAISAMIPAVLCFGLAFDVLGIENRIPTLEEVDSIYVNFDSWRGGAYLEQEDTQEIQEILTLHQSLIDNQAHSESIWAHRSGRIYDGTWDSRQIQITYYLTNGKRLERVYALYYDYADLEDSDSTASKLNVLYQNPKYRRSATLGDESEEEFFSKLIGGDFTYLTFNEKGYYDYQQYNFGEDTAREVAAAYLRDIDAGHVGALGLQKDAWSNSCWNDIRLHHAEEALAAGERGNYTMDYVQINPACTETIAALERTGVVTEERKLYTVAEEAAATKNTPDESYSAEVVQTYEDIQDEEIVEVTPR